MGVKIKWNLEKKNIKWISLGSMIRIITFQHPVLFCVHLFTLRLCQTHTFLEIVQDMMEQTQQ